MTILQEEPDDTIPADELYIADIVKLLQRRFKINLEVAVDGPSIVE